MSDLIAGETDNISWTKELNDKGEPGNVLARFVYRNVLDIRASKDANFNVEKRVIGVYAKAGASSDISYQEFKPENAAELVKRFPLAWEHFQKTRPKKEGDPLDALGITEDMILKFMALDIETVDDLANAEDWVKKRIYGSAPLIDAAKAQNAKEGKPKPRGRPKKEATDGDTKNDLRECA
jgi:hypothetical protein